MVRCNRTSFSTSRIPIISNHAYGSQDTDDGDDDQEFDDWAAAVADKAMRGDCSLVKARPDP